MRNYPFNNDGEAIEAVKQHGCTIGKDFIIRHDTLRWRQLDRRCQEAVSYLCDEWDYGSEFIAPNEQDCYEALLETVGCDQYRYLQQWYASHLQLQGKPKAYVLVWTVGPRGFDDPIQRNIEILNGDEIRARVKGWHPSQYAIFSHPVVKWFDNVGDISKL